jgi:hypothetical protein
MILFFMGYIESLQLQLPSQIYKVRFNRFTCLYDQFFYFRKSQIYKKNK